MKAHEVIEALRNLYPAQSYALLEQVGDGTGWSTHRHADAVVMSLWPSRGLTLTGIEVKVAKMDWKRELAQPEKAEAVASYCDFWMIAAPSGGLMVVTRIEWRNVPKDFVP